MIQLIDASAKQPIDLPEGRTTTILSPTDDGTRASVSLLELGPHTTFTQGAAASTQVIYVLDGTDAVITHLSGGDAAEYAATKRSGLYLEPGEKATVKSSGSPLTILRVTVPKHTDKATDNSAPVGYFFQESQLRSLVDEKGIRERTFWVNKETGLSESWDLQLGRMTYAPSGYSPRHVHNPSPTSTVTPEHFYLIEAGTGRVEYDGGNLAVVPGHLILIPAGEWHQLIASESGLDYIEFQAPFDFVTTMDHDPLGKNWYIKGTDDGTGRPELWVQS